MPAAGPATGQEYKSLALRLHPGHSHLCYLFVKRHKAQEGAEEQAQHAVYVTGIPYGVTDDDLVAIFSCLGGVVQVVLHQNGRSGLVVFDAAAAVSAVLAACTPGHVLEYELPQPEGPVGLRAWVAAHKALSPGNEVLQQQLDDWVARHEAAEDAAARRREQTMAEEGWTVVVRAKGRKRSREGAGGGTVVTGGVPLAAAAAAAEAAGGKQQQLSNFYRFQKRDQRRSELLELRQKFEEGRKRLAAVKAARNFRPG